MWPSIETSTFITEVGLRAAMHAETLPRDMRWFRGLW